MSLQAHLRVESVGKTDRGNNVLGHAYEPHARVASGSATRNYPEPAIALDDVESDEDEPQEKGVPAEENLDETEDLLNETGDFFDSNPES